MMVSEIKSGPSIRQMVMSAPAFLGLPAKEGEREGGREGRKEREGGGRERGGERERERERVTMMSFNSELTCLFPVLGHCTLT